MKVVHALALGLILAAQTISCGQCAAADASKDDAKLYEQIKLLTKKFMLARKDLSLNLIGPVKIGMPLYDGKFCGGFPSEELAIDFKNNRNEKNMMDVAAVSLYWERIFKHEYPLEIWKKPLEAFEGRLQRRTDSEDFYEDLKASTFDLWEHFYDYDVKHHRENHFGWNRTCGDDVGETYPVILKTDPPDGAVSIIPVFFFLLCRNLGLNPLDRLDCKYWRDILVGKPEEVAGEYYIDVKWSDGTKPPPRRYDFTRVLSGQTFTVRR